MKIGLLLLSLFAALAVSGRAQVPAPVLQAPFEPDPAVLAAPDADAAWKPFAELSDMEKIMALIGDAKGPDRQARMREIILQGMRLNLAFLHKYPQDPRRWTAVSNLASSAKFLANPDGTAKTPGANDSWNAAAWAAWMPHLAALEAQIATAPDAPAMFKLQAEAALPGGLNEIGKALNQAINAKQPVDFGPFRTEFGRLAAKYPDVPIWSQYVAGYVRMRTQAGTATDELANDLRELAASPSPIVAQAAQSEVVKLTRKSRPLEIAFTAVDGRQVDLKDYRGKVVLVDFWATWCGPCVKEIPNIKKVYAAYHDKGFEIIGIALENARLSPNDTPEQAAAKHEKAKQILNDFTTKAEMPWPQHYDGKFWKNSIAASFDITAIPAMFLIDQNGMLVTTEARGPKLEAEVKRLLGL